MRPTRGARYKTFLFVLIIKFFVQAFRSLFTVNTKLVFDCSHFRVYLDQHMSAHRTPPVVARIWHPLHHVLDGL